MLSLVLAFALIAVYFAIYEDPKHAMLRRENEELLNTIDENLVNISKLETSLSALHQKDNEFYRSILNADPITTGVWNGGVGGGADFDNQDQPFNLKDAEKRIDALQHKVNLQEKSYDELFRLAAENAKKLKHIPAIKPVPGKLISSFGMRMHPIHKIRKMHYGLDFQADTGTPIAAAGDGKVIFAGKSSGGYGYQIEVDHGFGYVTKYAHLKKGGIKVKKGQQVKRGEIIGLTGNTGLSKGPHLHYEIVKDGRKINPIDYFYADLSPEEYNQLRKEAEAAKDVESMD